MLRELSKVEQRWRVPTRRWDTVTNAIAHVVLATTLIQRPTLLCPRSGASVAHA
jgi:hypothetical protein